MLNKIRQFAASVEGVFETVDTSRASELAGQAFVLDARTPEEYADGHLKGAVLIPHTEVEARTAKLPGDKEKPILVYCAAGARSAHACQTLTRLGYKKVYNLDGGIIAWQDAGQPVVQ